MTVTAAETRVEYAGNGLTRVFTYPYQFFQGDDLGVWLFNDATEVGVQQILGTNYIVTGAMNPSGGNVTMTLPVPSGMTLIIINDPDIVQTLHYVNADDFPADSHEQGLDRLTKICQRLSDRVDRAVRAPDYAPEDSVPDADTLVGLVDQAEDAAENSVQAAADSAASATAAAGSATSAAGSATAAAGSADAAQDSADAAAQSAIDAEVNKITWRGHYSASTSYDIHDAVEYVGSSWVSLLDGNLGYQPDLTVGSAWDLMAQKGEPGPGGTGSGDMLRSQNLGDVLSVVNSRANLGLGNSAVLDVGTTANTVAAGNDPRFSTAVRAFVSATVPVGAKDGDLWWETDSGLLYLRYNDGDSTQWVITSPQPDFSQYLIKTGDTMTGDLTISKATPSFTLSKTAATQDAAIFGKNGASTRWAIDLGNAVAETGGNTGSDFTIHRYDDAGVFTGSVLSSKRTDGLLTVAADPTAALGVATKQYVDARITEPPTTISLAGGRSFDVAVPAGKNVAKITAVIFASSANATLPYIQVSLSPGIFKTTAGDYHTNGFYHQSNAANVISTTAADVSRLGIMIAGSQANLALPVLVDGMLIVRRPDTSHRFGANFRGQYVTAAGYLHTFWQTSITDVANPSLNIFALRIMSAIGDNWVDGSYLNVEWF